MFNLRSLDLNLLTVFEAIYELGTVGGAAERLALSQSATSHALSRLREACNDDLFVRARQGLTPTPVAEAMYPTINQALEALRAGLGEARGFDPTRSQRQLRISIPHPMGPFYALDLRAAAAAVAPGISLTFDTVSLPVDLEDKLRDGVLDIAIDWLPVASDPFVNTRLFDDRLVLVARSDHPSVSQELTTKELLKLEFVTPHRHGEIERLPRAISELYKLGLKVAVRVSELLEIPTVVASTDLLGIARWQSAITQRAHDRSDAARTTLLTFANRRPHILGERRFRFFVFGFAGRFGAARRSKSPSGSPVVRNAKRLSAANASDGDTLGRSVSISATRLPRTASRIRHSIREDGRKRDFLPRSGGLAIWASNLGSARTEVGPGGGHERGDSPPAGSIRACTNASSKCLAPSRTARARSIEWRRSVRV
jgi:DNA-binding transcriptional LysR family regulator